MPISKRGLALGFVGFIGILLETSCEQPNKFKPPLILPQISNTSLPESFHGFVFSPQDGLLHGWSSKGIRILDVKGNIHWSYSEWVDGIAYSTDGKTEAIFLRDKILINNKAMAIRGVYRWPVLLSPDGKSIFYGESEKVYIQSLTGNSEPFRFYQEGGRITAASYSPDGKAIAFGFASQSNGMPPGFGTLKVFDADPFRFRCQLYGSSPTVTMLAYTPDGKYIATAGKENEIYLWDAQTLQPIRIFSGFREAVRCFNFSPRGSLLAAGSDEKTIRIWNYTDGRLLHEIFPLNPKRVITTITRQLEKELEKDPDLLWIQDGVQDISFSLNGDQLAAAYGDNTVRVWDARKLYSEVGVLAGSSSSPE